MNPDRFIDLLKNLCQLDLDHPVLAGVSGGPDSLCMLDLLIKSGIKVYVTHINHQLRPGAASEAKRVQDFCATHQIECTIFTGNVRAYSEKMKLSIEEGARNFRYTRLFEQAKIVQAQAVLVAHNADDQVETVLMHLLRGSGSRGLRGMQMRSIQPQWSASIPLVRPLLKTGREEIMAYCAEHHLYPSYDESNQDARYFRNRIRQHLLPELKSYNPAINERLLNMAQVVQTEDDFLETQSDIAWSTCVICEEKRWIRFDRWKLLELHPALLQRVLWMAIHSIADTLRDIDFNVIERGTSFVKKKTGRNRLLLLSDIELIKLYHKELLICHANDPLNGLWPVFSPGQKTELNLAGRTDLGNGWQITCREIHSNSASFGNSSIGLLDGNKIQRGWADTFKPGDTFSPYGMNGKTMKLGDYWTNQGLPERARKSWPLIRNSDGEIVWIAGMQIADHYKVTDETGNVLEMELKYFPKGD